MIWIYAAFRYLDGQASRRFRWVVLMVLAMVFGFISKENQFMHGAIIGAFFAGLALWQIVGGLLFAAVAPALFLGGIGYWLHESGIHGFGAPVALLGVLASAGLLAYRLRSSGWAQLRRSPVADLGVIMLTLIMPFLAPFGHLLLGWDPMAYATSLDLLHSAALVMVMVILSVALAFYWFGMRAEDPHEVGGGPIKFSQWAQMMGLFWIIAILFYTTFLTNTRNGLATGIVGSLGYWLAQQQVARGGQPWYYYLMLGGLYEFLPMFLSIVGGVTALRWIMREPNWEPAPGSPSYPDSLEDVHIKRDSDVEKPHPIAMPVVDVDREQGALEQRLRQNRVYFIVFAIWWTIGVWLAYTVAGEKMPWLMTHLAVPMCVLGGWWFGWQVHHIDWAAALRRQALWLIGMVPALVFVAAILISSTPSFGRDVAALAATTRWLLAFLLGIGLIYLLVRWSVSVGWESATRLMTMGVVALLFLLTVRFSYMLNYINYDSATEYLVYAHGSPDIKRALHEIDLISERTVGARNIVVAYDDDTAWPLSWYMRLYPNNKFYGSTPNSDSMSAPVIIVGSKNYDKVHPYVARDYVKRTYRLIWWPDQGYFNLTWQRFLATVTDSQKMKNIWQIWFYRRYRDDADPTKWRDLMQWPNRHDFEMYVRRDIAAQIWDLSVAPVSENQDSMTSLLRQREIDVKAQNVYGDTYAGVGLNKPRAVAVGPDGTRVIADSGNNRIVVLDHTGKFLRAFGSGCKLGEGAASGCVDPDGAGPLELGDGQFNEPWGVTIDKDGNIYVADTWNGRIEVFDRDGKFIRKWGYFSTTNGELGDPNALFGPRGLAIDTAGNLLVADTGNKRILEFKPSGELVNQMGGGGVILGRFDEPVGIAVDPADGSIYVADTWNRRIQKLDPKLGPVAEWPVPGWESKEIYNKPFIAVGNNGDVYITDPQYYRVIVFSKTGVIKADFGDFGTDVDRFGLPNGIAFDAQNKVMLVADADNNRILALPALP